MTMSVGAVLPILATATGLGFSAFMPSVITKLLIEKALASPGGHAPIAGDRKALEEVLAEVRRIGYAINKGHLTPDACAIAVPFIGHLNHVRSEEHTSELQSLMRISYAVFCLKNKNRNK